MHHRAIFMYYFFTFDGSGFLPSRAIHSGNLIRSFAHCDERYMHVAISASFVLSFIGNLLHYVDFYHLVLFAHCDECRMQTRTRWVHSSVSYLIWLVFFLPQHFHRVAPTLMFKPPIMPSYQYRREAGEELCLLSINGGEEWPHWRRLKLNNVPRFWAMALSKEGDISSV